MAAAPEKRENAGHADSSKLGVLARRETVNTIGRVFLIYAALVTLAHAQARQSLVDLSFAGNDGEQLTIKALLTQPETPAAQKRPAVVILHHAGGWSAGTTAQYASFLAAQGFVTLELRMFDSDGDKEDTYRHLPSVFGGLAYLARQADIDDRKIALMGLSYGALLSLYAGTNWARTKYPLGELRYAAIAAFYPLCWVGKAYISRTIGKWKNKAYPESFMDQWAGIPLAIFAGEADDYESRDPKACTDFAAAIPDPKQKSLTRVQVYPGATHGWDHGRTYSFFARTACKGAGCNNTNESNPEITQKGMADLLKFLREALGP